MSTLWVWPRTVASGRRSGSWSPGARCSSTKDASLEDVLTPEEGAGPVAFAPSDPSIAYVITFDRKLHRSEDGGETWAEVA